MWQIHWNLASSAPAGPARPTCDNAHSASLPFDGAAEPSVVLYETLTRFMFRLCSALPRPIAPTPVSSCTTIIDLDAVSLNLLWNLRSHLQEASTLATANYPETLSTIAVVNSPSFFPTVWGWIKVRPPTTPSPASWQMAFAGFSSGQ